MNISTQSLYKSFKLIILSVFLFVFIAKAEEKEEGKFNPGEMIMHHITDAHEWHFATIGNFHITLPLPVIVYTETGLDIFMSSEFHHAKPYHEEAKHEEGKEKKEHKESHAVALTRGNNTYILEHEKIRLASGKSLIDFSITKNVASLLLSAFLLIFIFTSISASYRKNQGKAPKGLQSLLEPIIMFVRDGIAKDAIGAKYERFLPYLLTVFFFIWINNLMGLFPGGANLTGNIAVTVTLAVFTFLYTNLSGNKGYWMHIVAPPGAPWWLLPIMIPIEVIGLFTKPFALTVRLFANITAGHIIILSLMSLIFIFQSIIVGFVSTAFAVALTFLELLVAFLQAYIFTLLSAMYIGSAVAEHEHEHGHEEAHH